MDILFLLARDDHLLPLGWMPSTKKSRVPWQAYSERRNRRNGCRWIGVAWIACTAYALAAPASAATLFWVGGDGSWDDGDNWSLTEGGVGGAGQPQANDTANIDNGADTVTYANSTVTDALHILQVNSSTGTATFNQSQDTLDVNNEFLATDGTAIFNQNGGMHEYLAFTIASGTSGNGTYNLMSGTLSGSGLTAGTNGTALVQHTGGNHESNLMSLGFGGAATGTYTLRNGSKITW